MIDPEIAAIIELINHNSCNLNNITVINAKVFNELVHYEYSKRIAPNSLMMYNNRIYIYQWNQWIPFTKKFDQSSSSLRNEMSVSS